jgi:hypothetical protein
MTADEELNTELLPLPPGFPPVELGVPPPPTVIVIADPATTG